MNARFCVLITLIFSILGSITLAGTIQKNPAAQANTSIIKNAANWLVASYKITDLKNPEGRSIEWVTNINKSGQVVGTTGFNSQNHFFLWNEETGYTFSVSKLGAFYPAFVPFINDKGTLSENPITNNGDQYKVDSSGKLRKNNIIVACPLKWRVGDFRLRVNNSGQVLGNIESSPNKHNLVIWNESNGQITYIYPESKYEIISAGINDRGWVVGWFSDGRTMHGILWTPEVGIQTIPNFSPTAINNHGVIAGHINVTGEYSRAALWIQGKVIDVSNELKIDSNMSTELLFLSEISGINDYGHMVGWGIKNSAGQQQAVVIAPISEKQCLSGTLK